LVEDAAPRERPLAGADLERAAPFLQHEDRLLAVHLVAMRRAGREPQARAGQLFRAAFSAALKVLQAVDAAHSIQGVGQHDRDRSTSKLITPAGASQPERA